MSSEEIKARPVGRFLRLIMGVAMTVEGGRHLVGNQLMLSAQVAGVFVAELLFYLSLHIIISRFFSSVNRWLGAVLAVTPVFLVFILSDAPGRLGTLIFIGVSLLFTAIRSEGGCEVMTIPGMVLGRRTHLVCIAFSPIDWIEERLYKLFGRSESSEKPTAG